MTTASRDAGWQVKTLVLDSALSPFRELFGVETEIHRDMMTDSFCVRLTWLVSADELMQSRNYNAALCLLAPLEAIRVADDRALIESGRTPIVLGED